MFLQCSCLSPGRRMMVSYVVTRFGIHPYDGFVWALGQINRTPCHTKAHQHSRAYTNHIVTPSVIEIIAPTCCA